MSCLTHAIRVTYLLFHLDPVLQVDGRAVTDLYTAFQLLRGPVHSTVALLLQVLQVGSAAWHLPGC